MKNNKIKILGIDKSAARIFLVLEKKEEFIKYFEKFLEELGFGWLQTHGFFKPDGGMELKNIKKIFDVHRLFLNTEYNIELIIGKEKIFLIIYTRENKQQFITDKIEEFCYM